MVDEFIIRVGTFFILLGLGLIGLFVLSDLAKMPSCNYLVFGGLSLGLGVFLWFRDPVKPGPPPDRFQVLKGFGKKPAPKGGQKPAQKK